MAGFLAQCRFNGQTYCPQQSSLAEVAARFRKQVYGKQLEQQPWLERWLKRQQVLTVGSGVGGLTVVIGVAGGIVKRVPPTDQTEQIQECFI